MAGSLVLLDAQANPQAAAPLNMFELWWCSGSDDIIVGAPVAGRNSVECEGLIGAFLGAVAIRTDLSGEPSFRELLHRVRAASLESYTNADTPIHKVHTTALALCC